MSYTDTGKSSKVYSLDLAAVTKFLKIAAEVLVLIKLNLVQYL